MRALVTGGYGYIGGHLVEALLRNGWEVSILDTMFNSRDWDWGSDGRVSAYKDTICNLDAVNRALRGVTVVYHLAARMDRSQSVRHPIRMFHTNVTGTATLLTAAHEAGIDNIVFTSSAAVYGNVIGAEEFGPMQPVNLLGCSKLAAEKVALHFQNIGLNVKILRPFNVWGNGSESVVDKFIQGHTSVHGDGNQTRDFVHVKDVVRALLSAHSWEPSAYNLGTGVETTIGGLYDKLGKGEPTMVNSARGDEVFRSCASTELTEQRTGWKPKILLHELYFKEIRQLCQ
ncbi:MAG: NAD-dependent epimerase/dehydratase family protein [Candidatus Thorarchaeota archaeon]|jgi:UDP-glucose 4-epimerase